MAHIEFWQGFDADQGNRKSFELPGAKPHYNPDRPGQVEHIALELDLDIPNHAYHGVCRIRIKPIQSGITQLTLDAVNLNIDSVTVEGTPQPFENTCEELLIHLTQPTQRNQVFTVAIAYQVSNPQRGIYFVPPVPGTDEGYQVWTQGEDEDSRFWFPCFDYPGQLATSEIRVRVPKQYVAISNGTLIATEEQGDAKIYHWFQQEVHPTYLMTLAVGEFVELQDSWNGKPITYYVERGHEDDARRTMGKTPQMVEFFSQAFGYPYAYPKYAQVCVRDFIFGGMENTSTTLLTDRCLLDERATLDNRRSETLVAHELAHQWFGDLVVIKHWSHAWIKEGMASYSEVLWVEREYGADEAAYYLLGEARSYLDEDRSRYRRPIVTHVYREAIELYDRHLYEKGACVYHMIRTALGDELFDAAIHHFVQANAHKTVETIDLLRAIESTTGRNLQFLFDQYVFRGGHPDYSVTYAWDDTSNLAKLTVTQTQAKEGDTSSTSGLFDLVIPIGFGYVQGDRPSSIQTFKLRVHERQHSFYIPLSQKPQFVSFDQGNHTLKTVALEYPLAELKAQLQYDPDPIGRIFAAEALAKKGTLDVVDALTTALQHDPFWGVRAEVASQLGSIRMTQALSALISGLQDSHPNVRRAVVGAIGQFKTLDAYQAVKQVAEQGDPSYYVEATALTQVGAIANSPLDQTSQEDDALALFQKVLQERAGWNEVVRSGAIAGLGKLKSSEAALNLILSYTAPETPQALRLAAIRALGAISTGQTPDNLQRILERLEELVNETFFLTQVAASSALGSMETLKALPILQRLADHTPDGRVRRLAEESVQSVRKKAGADQRLEQLQKELDQIKQDNQDLRSRLAALEAKGS